MKTHVKAAHAVYLAKPMIAILDTTRDGWKFVRILSGLGHKVSWIVPEDKAVGFDALPANFRGCVHKIGFEDQSMIDTAMAGCESKLILAEGKKFGKIASKAIHSASETKGDLPAFLVLANGGAYEYTELPHYKAPPAKSVANEQANLLPLQHVG